MTAQTETSLLRGRMMEYALPRAFAMTRPYEEAFLKAFDDYADALFRHAAFRLSGREKAADLTQETFLKAWDYVRGGGEVRSWKSFLYRVLNNLIIDEYRRAREESLDALAEHDPVRASASLATGSRAEKEEALDDELMIRKLRLLIPKLPDTLRAVIALRYVDGLLPREIASVLDLSENVVSVRIHRGVARLKELFAAQMP